MAILLKEITVRYTPKSPSFLQLLTDYYAMFNVWQTAGSGGQAGVAGQRRTGFVDDVFEQVATQVASMLNRRLGNQWKASEDSVRKDTMKFNHALKMQDWPDFHAALNSILSVVMGENWVRGFNQKMTRPKEDFQNLTPVIQNFVKSTFKLPDEPKPEPKWKSLDKPLSTVPTAIQRDLPMAGGQIDLPLKPAEKLPTLPKDLPPLDKSFDKGGAKRIGANWEKLLSDFGYNWSESDNAYKNDKRNVLIQVSPNNSVRVFLPGGKTKVFANLGLLFRQMAHNKQKRHGKEPVAQVTQENYTQLFELLYQH